VSTPTGNSSDGSIQSASWRSTYASSSSLIIIRLSSSLSFRLTTLLSVISIQAHPVSVLSHSYSLTVIL
jgi:hypothetical protein